MFVHLLPGDPARLAAGPDATPETVALVRQDLGLDRSLPEQFVRFATGGGPGRFRSIVAHQAPRLHRSRRALHADLLADAGGDVVVGDLRHAHRRRFRGMAQSLARQVGHDAGGVGHFLPAFALGMVLMQIFAVQLNWLPTVGAATWKHYILPSLTLGAAVAAIMARFTRSSFVDILQEDYVRTARAKGLSENVVVIKHGLRNALIPVVTMMGLQFGFLLGGSIVVEVVFNWPGMGRLLVDAVDMRDYPIIQAEVLLFSFEFILINLIVDVLYAVINPTIRYR